MFTTMMTLALFAPIANPETARLWPADAPGAVGKEDRDIPTLTRYTPAEPNGTAVVVCPGGGYGGLAMDHEGKQIAEWLIQRGITAFVLKYRLAPHYHEPAPMLDAQRALRTVRANAEEYGIKADRIGIWGFSAGGHLASTAGTHFDDGKSDSEDAIEKASCRPDFLILSYPVITMDEKVTHMGSRNNLIGKTPDAAKVEFYSNEKQVTAKTPPTFIFHTSADTAVIPENAILFYSACRKNKVPVELHIYENGPHGVGLAQKDPVLSSWPGRLEAWLKVRGFVAK